MSEEPVVFKSQLPYKIILFVVLVTWILAGATVVDFMLVTLISGFAYWLVFAPLIELTAVFPLFSVSRKLKRQIQFIEPNWDFRNNEVEFTEFTEMMNEYGRSYAGLISKSDKRFLLVALLGFCLAIGAPILMISINPVLLLHAPLVFAGSSLLCGASWSAFVFRDSTNDASEHLPYCNPRRLQRAVQLMASVPCVSWVGVGLTIGEAGGYYTIRNPMVVARIEGIEGVARIELILGDYDRIVGAVSRMMFESTEDSVSIETEPLDRELKREDLLLLVRRTVEAYVGAKGADELLEDVMDELGIKFEQVSEAEETETHPEQSTEETD